MTILAFINKIILKNFKEIHTTNFTLNSLFLILSQIFIFIYNAHKFISLIRVDILINFRVHYL